MTMASSSLVLPISLLSYLALLQPVQAGEGPVAASWSDTMFGPDGPWPAVEVTLGSNQKISMYPGREFQSFLLTSDYCNDNTTIPCYANQAGLYNDAKSQLDSTGSTGHIAFQSNPDYMLGVDVKGEMTESWVDTMDFNGATIENVSLALLTSSYMAYPNGQWYPMSVGCLGIGAPETVNQSFSNSYGPAINASLIPGYLWAQNTTASNSFGMHIGSANPRMPGSFYFGGYDQNRVVGDILSYSEDYTKAISLKDVGIRVIDGSSPWDFESKDGLLSSGNSSINSGGIQVSVDGCSPYLSLPKSTCDAIASELPVTYNKDLGLYFWNTDDTKYTQIVNSASVLEFVFLGGSNTKNVTISVPFRHLNLTLTAPLVEKATQYFPCYAGPSKSYTLGRAFLQDAFVGANWGTKSWWLAQAPGPNVPAPSVVELQNEDSIKASTNDWKESWSGSWKALSPDEVGSSASVSAPSATVSQDATGAQTTGLSTGAKAGIGVGVGIAGLALIGAIAFFFLRRRNTPAAAAAEGATPATAYNPHDGPSQGYYAPVKNPSSPGMTQASTVTPGSPPNGMMYDPRYVQYQQYPQSYPPQFLQQYPQQYPQQFTQYSQSNSSELAAVGNTPTELPGSTTYDPHLLDGTQVYHQTSPQQTYVPPQTPHSPGQVVDQSPTQGQHQGR